MKVQYVVIAVVLAALVLYVVTQKLPPGAGRADCDTRVRLARAEGVLAVVASKNLWGPFENIVARMRERGCITDVQAYAVVEDSIDLKNTVRNLYETLAVLQDTLPDNVEEQIEGIEAFIITVLPKRLSQVFQSLADVACTREQRAPAAAPAEPEPFVRGSSGLGPLGSLLPDAPPGYYYRR